MKLVAKFFFLSFFFINSIVAMDQEIDPAFEEILAKRDIETCLKLSQKEEFSEVPSCLTRCVKKQINTSDTFFKFLEARTFIANNKEKLKEADLEEEVEIIEQTSFGEALSIRDSKTCRKICRGKDFSKINDCQTKCMSVQFFTFLDMIKNAQNNQFSKSDESKLGDYADIVKK